MTSGRAKFFDAKIPSTEHLSQKMSHEKISFYDHKISEKLPNISLLEIQIAC